MANRRPRRERQRAPIDTSHHRRLVNPFEPLRVLSDDHVQYLHESAVRFLADEGIRVLLEEARDLLAVDGATVEDDMVRFDPDRIAEALSLIHI